MDSLQVMKTVVVVADRRSFTGAAERLRTTTQMVSKYVKSFEERMGVRVFDRTTRKVRVTEEGQVVLERCRQILDAVEELEASVQDRQSSLRGRLRVAAPLTFGELYLSPHVASFRALYPEVEVSLFLTDRFVSLIEEGVDIAIRIGRLEDSSLVIRKLAETEMVCVGSPGYLKGRGRPTHPRQLEEHHIVHDENLRGGRRWVFFKGGSSVRVDVRPAVSVNSARAAEALAESGVGLALLPRFVAVEALNEGRLVRVLKGWQTVAVPIHVLFPHAHLLTARVRSFADHLTEAIRSSDL